MKSSPLTTLFFTASVLVYWLGCDSCECPASLSALKSVVVRAESAVATVPTPPALAPAATRPPAAAPASRAEAPRPDRRPLPAHLFM